MKIEYIYYIIIPIIVTILGWLLPLIKSNGIGNTWKCKKRADSLSNFFKLTFIIFLMVCVGIFVADFIQMIINGLFSKKLIARETFLDIAIAVIMFIVYITFLYINKKCKFITVRKKSGKIRKFLSHALIVMLFLILTMAFWTKNNYNNILSLAYIIVMVTSIFVYDTKIYIEYPIADIYIEGEEAITNIDVNNMSNNKHFLIIKHNNSEIRILQNRITRIDYHHNIKDIN